ncbi:MAG: glycosyltransferase family 2 protein [bacterium]|nr:glycosyltransferase family 2 protein [bacterium]
MIPRKCVSVVVVTYNSEVTIANCISSVFDTSANWIESFVIVDNASSDRTGDVVKRSIYPVATIENKVNQGFGRACNSGADESESEFILLLNPDARVDRDTIKNLVTFLDAREAAACCGPLIRNEKGTPDPACRRGFPTPMNALGRLFYLEKFFTRSRNIAGYSLPWLGFGREARVDCISGACILIRRSDYRRIAGFDEQFFLFGEDVDLCKRVALLERETWFVPSARITHIGGHSMRQVKETANYEFYRAMRIYMSKHWQHLPRFTYKTIDMGIGFRAWLEKFIGH